MKKTGLTRALSLGLALACVSVVPPTGLSSLYAQATSGDLVGTVKDSTGASIPNATVTVVSEGTGVVVTTTTGTSGEYRASNLLPGKYDVSATAAGFQAFQLNGVAIQLNKTSTAPLLLSVGTTQSVEVTASAGVVLDTTSNNLTTTFDATELATLPIATVGNGVLNASLLAPNVASGGGAGIGTGPSVGGQRPRNNNYTIEGIDDNNKSVTGPLIEIPNDAVGEFTLITSQFSPEFGHSSGGQFNTNIISGTNKFHGRAYEYFQNRNLNAENAIAGGKTPNTPYDANRFGGQIGGPIVHDKLFFFINYERATTRASSPNFVCTPTAAGRATLTSLIGPYGLSATNVQQYLLYTPIASVNGGAQVTDANDLACFNGAGPQVLAITNNPLNPTAETDIPTGNAAVPTPTRDASNQYTTSADYTLSAKDNFRFRYIYENLTALNSVTAVAFNNSTPEKFHLGTLSYFHNFTPNLVNEARIGFNRFSQVFPVTGPGFPGLSQFPNLTIFDAGVDLGPPDNSPQSGIQNLYQLTDNVSYTKGRHTLKFGFDGRKYISPQNFVQRQRGDYEYSGLDVYAHDLAPDEFGERSTGAQNYAGDQTAFYGYGNDTYRASSKLTFNVGLRYEFTSVPSGERQEALNAISNTTTAPVTTTSAAGVVTTYAGFSPLTFAAPQPSYRNFAPRVGVAFAPDEKTSIRAGFGISYDVLFDNLGLLSSPPQLSQTADVGTTPGFPVYGANFLANGGLPAVSVPITSVAIARSKTAAYLPNQVLPYSENYSLTVQRIVAKSYTVEVQYLGTRGIHLPVQNQQNVQPRVTAANQLATFFTGPTLSASGTYATTATGTNANTLAAIQANSNIIAAYKAANFTSKITSYQPYGASNYNGIGINVTHPFSSGFQMLASYTYSAALDDSTAEVNASALTERRPLDSQNIHQEYSRSALSRANRLTVEAVYDLPFFKHSNFFLRNVLGNYTLSPVYTYESPELVTVTSNTNSNLNGDAGAVSRTIINGAGDKSTSSGVVPVYSNNPTLVALCGVGVTRCAADEVGYLAKNANAYYVTAGQGTLPNAQRNTLAGRPIDNVDLTASKRISFADHYAFEFQAQAFNLLNHAQYVPGAVSDIAGTASTSNQTALLSYLTAGTANFNKPQTAYTAHARSMQLVAKFSF